VLLVWSKNPRLQMNGGEGRSTQWWFFRLTNSFGGSVSVGHLEEAYPLGWPPFYI